MRNQILLIQIAVSVIFLFWLSMREHMRNKNYTPSEGVVEMIFFLALLERNTSTLVQLDWLTYTELRNERHRKYIRDLRQQYIRLIEEGKFVPAPLPERFSFWKDSVSVVLMTIVIVPTAPVAAFAMDWGEEDGKTSMTRLVHPLQRAHHLSQIIGVLLPMAGWIAATTLLRPGYVRVMITAILVIGFLRLMYAGIKVIEWQDQWKKYWKGEFAVLMQIATHHNDHDLFNRALNLQSIVDRYPVFPLTAIQRTTVLVFAIVQFILTQFG